MVCVGVAVKRTMYQRKVDVDMLNAVKSVLANARNVSQHIVFLPRSAYPHQPYVDTLYAFTYIDFQMYSKHCPWICAFIIIIIIIIMDSSVVLLNAKIAKKYTRRVRT